jgi:hypothetical protein
MAETVKRRVSVPGNGQVDVMADTPFLFPPNSPGNMISIAAVAEAVGVVLDVKFGTREISDAASLNVVAAGIGPDADRDQVVAAPAAQTERMRVVARNTTGAPVFADVLVLIA